LTDRNLCSENYRRRRMKKKKKRNNKKKEIMKDIKKEERTGFNEICISDLSIFEK
jgi:hypothetical protein